MKAKSIRIGKKSFHTPSVPKYDNISDKIEEANKTVQTSTMNILKVYGAKNMDQEISKLNKNTIQKSNEKINFNSTHKKQNTKSLIKIQKKKLEELEVFQNLLADNEKNLSTDRKIIRKNIKLFDVESIKKELEIKKEKKFGIEFKKRPNSVEFYISRDNIRLSLVIKSAVKHDSVMFFLTNAFQTTKRIFNVSNKKFKSKAKSFELDKEEYTLKKFYEKLYLKNEKKRIEEEKRKKEIEKNLKIMNFKKMMQKDKYNNSMMKDRDRSSNTNSILMQINKNKILGNFHTINNNNESNNGSSVYKKNTNYRNIKSQSSSTINKLTLDLGRGPLSMDIGQKKINNFSKKHTFYTFDQNEMKDIYDKETNYTNTKTKFFSTTTSDFKFKRSTSINISDKFKFNPSIYSSPSAIVNQTNSNSSKFASSINFSNFFILKKNILHACSKAVNESIGFQTEFSNYTGLVSNVTSDKIENLRRVNNIDLSMIYMQKDMKEQCRKYKSVKRLFVYPNGQSKKSTFLSEDPKNMIIISNKIDNLKDANAYTARHVIFEKFNAKLNTNDIIGHKDNLKMSLTQSEIYEMLKKKKSDQISLRSRQYANHLSLRNSMLHNKLDALLKKNKKNFYYETKI